MAAVSTIAATAAAAGIATSIYGSFERREAQRDVAQASQAQENIRRQQLELENIRRQREIIRKAQAARAVAITSAANAGVMEGSLVGGATGQITGQLGQGLTSQAQNTSLGRQMFDANANLADAQASVQQAEAISDFGRTLFQSSQAIGQIGATAIGRLNSPGQGPYLNWETTVERVGG